MARAIWKGAISFGLVHIPVALVSASSSQGVDFDWLDKRSMEPVGYKRINKVTGKEVDKENIVKGVQYEKGRYVVLSEEEIRSAHPVSTQTIDIFSFVDSEQIPLPNIDTPYYLAPDGKLAQEAFGVIREAMERSGQIALGRVVMSTRERLLALEPRGNGILAYTLRTDAEVRKADEIFDSIVDKAPDASMIAIAEKIIEQREGPFDPSQFVDRYEEALKALIADKQKGHKIAKVEEPEDTNVIDLMAALRASLSGKEAGKTGKPDAAAKSAKSAAKSNAKPVAKAKAAPKAAAHKARKAS